LQGVARHSKIRLFTLFFFSDLPVVAGGYALSGVSVVSNSFGFAVIAGIGATSSTVAVALVAASREKEFSAGRIFAEAGRFILGYEKVKL
jgi:hypothetical protein